MAGIYQRFAVAVATTTIVAIIGSISKAEAFQLFTDRTQWEAALNAPTKTLDFGEYKVFSEPTVLPNGVSASVSVGTNGQLFAEGTKVGAISDAVLGIPGPIGGSVRGFVDVKLPSAVKALGFDAHGGAFTGSSFSPVIPRFLSNNRIIAIEPGGSILPSGFYGIISQSGDPLITGLSLGSNSAGTPKFYAQNITFSSVSVPEGSSTLGILVAFGTFGLGTAFLRRQKQYKSTTAVH